MKKWLDKYDWSTFETIWDYVQIGIGIGCFIAFWIIVYYNLGK